MKLRLVRVLKSWSGGNGGEDWVEGGGGNDNVWDQEVKKLWTTLR